MTGFRRLFPLLLLLPLAGCFSDQKSQLRACEATAPQTGAGEPFKAVKACMDKAGYRFIGWNEGVVCNMAAVVRGKPAGDGTDALCFEPKGWLALKIYRIEVPTRTLPAR